MEVIIELIQENHDHIINLVVACTLGLIGALVNYIQVKDFKNGFQVGRIMLSVSFVSPTIYILFAGFVDTKLQIALTILSGAFHEEALGLLRRRFENMKSSIEMSNNDRDRSLARDESQDKKEETK